MAQQRSPKNLAKLLAYILGRRPDEFGLVPDDEGYVRIKDLLKAIHEEEGWRYVRRSHLDEIRITLADPPFEMDASLIRAKLREHLPKIVSAPDLPKLLYTCIRTKAYPHVSEKGIFPQSHPQVILSSDEQLALRIGRRIDSNPVMLTVQVQTTQKQNVAFRQAGENLFLADTIPADCFTGPPLPKEKPGLPDKEKLPPAAYQKSAGSFTLQFKEKAGAQPSGPSGQKSSKKRNGKKDRSKSKKQRRQAPPWRK